MPVSRNDHYNYLHNGGKVSGTVDASAATISNLFNGNSADQEVTITDNGVGDFTIAITNFRGTQNVILAHATPLENDAVVSVRAGTFTASTDTANVQFLVRTVEGTPAAVDRDFNFVIEAY